MCALASEAPGEPLTFYVDSEWSGRSSALKQDRHGDNAKVEMVRQTSVDTLLEGRAGPGDRLVFKIEVEGYKPKVLAGMRRTLDAVDSAVCVMEFNQSFLRKLGVEPETYLAELKRRFTVWLLDKHDRPIDLRSRALSSIGPEAGEDIVVATRPELLDRLFS